MLEFQKASIQERATIQGAAFVLPPFGYRCRDRHDGGRDFNSSFSEDLVDLMKFRLLVLFVAVASMIAAVAAWKMTAGPDAPISSSPPPAPGSSGSNERRNHHSLHLAELINRRSVDRAHVRALGPKGFAISRTGPLRPEGDALTRVNSLLPQSQAGDSSATLEIFLTVLDCKQAYSKVPAVPDDTTSRRLAECEALLTNISIADSDWLSKAAEQGNVEAKILYSLNPTYTLPGGPKQYLKDPEAVQAWRTKSLSYLEQAVAVGSQDAMLSLSDAYKTGIIVDQDAVAQLGYALAAQRLSPIPGFEDSYQPLKSSLTPAQRAEADRRATQILTQCCKD